jgi:RNA polymerase sigma factor (sigma-70 family)
VYRFRFVGDGSSGEAEARSRTLMQNALQYDNLLVERAAAGDAEAFGELYRQHAEPIYRYVIVRVKNPDDAEDLTEQVFLKAWEALPGYEQRGYRFSSWLYRIAHNTVIDYRRSKQTTTSAPFPDHDSLECTRPTALDQVIHSEQSSALASAISQLPKDQRQVIWLRFVEGLNHAEVARILAKSAGATRIIQHRALTTLNHMLTSVYGVALLLIAVLTNGMVFAADFSLPGDALYSVKRATEQARLLAALEDRQDTQLLASFSARRIDEAGILLEKKRYQDVISTLNAYAVTSAQFRVILEQHALPEVQRVTLAHEFAEQEAQLDALRDQAPFDTLPAFTQAVDAAHAARNQAQGTVDIRREIDGAAPKRTPPPTAHPTTTPTPAPTAQPTSVVPQPRVTEPWRERILLPPIIPSSSPKPTVPPLPTLPPLPAPTEPPPPPEPPPPAEPDPVVELPALPTIVIPDPTDVPLPPDFLPPPSEPSPPPPPDEPDPPPAPPEPPPPPPPDEPNPPAAPAPPPEPPPPPEPQPPEEPPPHEERDEHDSAA